MKLSSAALGLTALFSALTVLAEDPHDGITVGLAAIIFLAAWCVVSYGEKNGYL